jgi:hypothetical protein
MKLYLTICAAIGLLLGWAFVSEWQRYDQERHGDNDDYETWTLANWKRWKELHWDKPPPEGKICEDQHKPPGGRQ